MVAYLSRFAYLRECTLGWLEYRGLKLATLERPWIPVPEHQGGKLRESCVPDGEYKLIHHSGTLFQNVFALENTSLNVHHQPGPGKVGRSAILIHAGNRVRDVIGCVAVGVDHSWMGGEHSIIQSQIALSKLREEFKDGLPSLVLRPSEGTKEIGW